MLTERRKDTSVQTRGAFIRTSTFAASGVAFAGIPRFVRGAQTDIATLQGKLHGTLVFPTSKDYETLRRTFSFNPRTSAYPSIIAMCASEDDVARVFDYARNRGLDVAVRSGGHDVLGASTVNDGVIIDLSELNHIDVVADRKLATVGAGVLSGDLSDALQKSAQAAALGCNPQVGVSGLTLGGGIGWLLGTAGAACDNLIQARMLTTDGRMRDVDAQSEPDLFWAIRGGGGNFGIVTSLTYQTHDVGEIIGGWIAYPGERVIDFLRFYREFMDAAPPELVIEVFVPSALQPVLFAQVAFTGSQERAQRVLDPLMRFGPPLVSDVGSKPYAGFSAPGEAVAKLLKGPPADPHEATSSPGIYWLGANVDLLSDEAIAVIADRLKEAPKRNWAFSLGHYLHGAICDVPSNASPFLRKRGSMTFHFDTWWSDAGRAAGAMEWVDASLSAMRPCSSASTYVNYLGSDSSAAVEASYGENYARLRTLKQRYDPDDLLRRNRNIRPIER